MDKKTQEKLNAKYLEFQMLEQQLKELEDYSLKIKEQLNNALGVEEALKDFKKLEKGKEILAPVGEGIFLKAKLVDNKNLKINIGSDCVVTKSVKEVENLIKKEREEIEKVYKNIMDEIQKILTRVSQLDNEINRLMGS